MQKSCLIRTEVLLTINLPTVEEFELFNSFTIAFYLQSKSNKSTHMGFVTRKQKYTLGLIATRTKFASNILYKMSCNDSMSWVQEQFIILPLMQKQQIKYFLFAGGYFIEVTNDNDPVFISPLYSNINIMIVYVLYISVICNGIYIGGFETKYHTININYF